MAVPARQETAALAAHRAEAWRFWTDVLGAPRHVCAPMVWNSEAAFRCLVRDHGAHLAYTPMWRAAIVCQYRDSPEWTPRTPAEKEAAGILYDVQCAPEQDRPLIAQLCATKVEDFVAAAQILEPFVDAIDLNLGCPQNTAKREGFGAYLMDDLPRVEAMLRAARAVLHKPITAKVRLFPTLTATRAYLQMLEAAGCSLIAIHARLRGQRHHQGQPDFAMVREARDAVDIPLLVNGGVRSLRQAESVLEYTGVAGVMVAGALLELPRLFAGQMDLARLADARLYLQYAERYPPPAIRYVRDHLMTLLKPVLYAHLWLDLYNLVNRNRRVCTLEQYRLILAVLEHRLQYHRAPTHGPSDERLDQTDVPALEDAVACLSLQANPQENVIQPAASIDPQTQPSCTPDQPALGGTATLSTAEGLPVHNYTSFRAPTRQAIDFRCTLCDTVPTLRAIVHCAARMSEPRAAAERPASAARLAARIPAPELPKRAFVGPFDLKDAWRVRFDPDVLEEEEDDTQGREAHLLPAICEDLLFDFIQEPIRDIVAETWNSSNLREAALAADTLLNEVIRNDVQRLTQRQVQRHLLALVGARLRREIFDQVVHRLLRETVVDTVADIYGEAFSLVVTRDLINSVVTEAVEAARPKPPYRRLLSPVSRGEVMDSQVPHDHPVRPMPGCAPPAERTSSRLDKSFERSRPMVLTKGMLTLST